jgi:hypothetical protein
MSSLSKCPSCGLTNFSSAVVCRQCQCPLIGEVARAIRSGHPTFKRVSYRWIVNALLISIGYAVLLFFAIFLIYVIPGAMYSSETGWRDFTSEQIASMKFWYFVLLGGGVALIFLFFFLRRHNDL